MFLMPQRLYLAGHLFTTNKNSENADIFNVMEIEYIERRRFNAGSLRI